MSDTEGDAGGERSERYRRWMERRKRWHRRPRWMRVLMFVGLAAVIALVGGAVVMGLWNWLAPTLFGGAQINWIQGLGIFALARLLFGGWGRGRHHGHHDGGHWRSRWHSKMEGLSPEERERMKQMMRGRF